MKWGPDVIALFENTADGVWAIGPDGRIVFWNRAAEAILEYSAQQVVGQWCHEIFAGSDCNGNRICGVRCPNRTLAESGELVLVQHFDMATRTRTGNPVWLDVSSIPLPTGDDQPPTVVHLFRDVTVARQIDMLVRRQLVQQVLATREEPRTLTSNLSQRELEIVGLMQVGLATAAIAERLYISKATVRNHIQNILNKLEVHTRLEAMALVNQITQRMTGTGKDRKPSK